MPKCQNKLDLSNKLAVILPIYYHLYFTLPHFYTFIEFLMLNRVLQCLFIENYIRFCAIMKRKLAFLFSIEANNDLWYMNLCSIRSNKLEIQYFNDLVQKNFFFFFMTFCIWWFHDNLHIIGRPSVIKVNRWHLQREQTVCFSPLVIESLTRQSNA